MNKLYNLIKSQKNVKLVSIVSVLAIAMILGVISALNSDNSTDPAQQPFENQTQVNDEYASMVGKTYPEFSKNEITESEKAVKLAEDYYLKENGEIRETTSFFAETLKDGSYMVTGIDSLDGRDSRFITLQVNIKSKSVTPVDSLTQ